VFRLFPLFTVCRFADRSRTGFLPPNQSLDPDPRGLFRSSVISSASRLCLGKFSCSTSDCAPFPAPWAVVRMSPANRWLHACSAFKSPGPIRRPLRIRAKILVTVRLSSPTHGVDTGCLYHFLFPLFAVQVLVTGQFPPGSRVGSLSPLEELANAAG